MVFFTLLILICLQQPTVSPDSGADSKSLILDQTVQGSVDDGALMVHTPTLDQSYTNAPTVGLTYSVQVPETGIYRFELRSWAFDSYLILQSADGSIIAEDDDGLLLAHSRIAYSLEAGKHTSLRLVRCTVLEDHFS
ncbi:MAG: hypothetical protein HQ519_04210 [Planctomycetes bacterium]|nr:hypothetical protein [Planctomycetota bacterium]